MEIWHFLDAYTSSLSSVTKKKHAPNLSLICLRTKMYHDSMKKGTSVIATLLILYTILFYAVQSIMHLTARIYPIVYIEGH